MWLHPLPPRNYILLTFYIRLNCIFLYYYPHGVIFFLFGYYLYFLSFFVCGLIHVLTWSIFSLSFGRFRFVWFTCFFFVWCSTVILILVSQRADEDVIRLVGTDSMKQQLLEDKLRQRGRGPTKLELLVVLYLFGFVWEEIQEIFAVGMKAYLRNMWNFIDFLRNSLYISVVCLR